MDIQEHMSDMKTQELLNELLKEISEENSFFLSYNSSNNTIDCDSDSFDYFNDEIKEALLEKKFWNITVYQKAGIFDYYTIAETESEALNFTDIFLNSDYYKAEVYQPSIETID